jgi:hypothetical protein
MRERSLRRGTDRVEDAAAWLLTVAGMALLIVAGVLGVGGYSQGMERARSDQADRAQATAVLLRNAPELMAEHGSAAPFARVPARWTDAVGVQHEGAVLARSTSRAGTRIQVWLDRRGQLVGPPADQLNALVDGVGTATVVLAVGAGLILGAWAGLRRVIRAHNIRAWEREWARIGPGWSSQQPS